jgi:hypothetical protein
MIGVKLLRLVGLADRCLVDGANEVSGTSAVLRPVRNAVAPWPVLPEQDHTSRPR